MDLFYRHPTLSKEMEWHRTLKILCLRVLVNQKKVVTCSIVNELT